MEHRPVLLRQPKESHVVLEGQLAGGGHNEHAWRGRLGLAGGRLFGGLDERMGLRSRQEVDNRLEGVERRGRCAELGKGAQGDDVVERVQIRCAAVAPDPHAGLDQPARSQERQRRVRRPGDLSRLLGCEGRLHQYDNHYYVFGVPATTEADSLGALPRSSAAPMARGVRRVKRATRALGPGNARVTTGCENLEPGSRKALPSRQALVDGALHGAQPTIADHHAFHVALGDHHAHLAPDADRLDLPRVGVAPIGKSMSTPVWREVQPLSTRIHASGVTSAGPVSTAYDPSGVARREAYEQHVHAGSGADVIDIWPRVR